MNAPFNSNHGARQHPFARPALMGPNAVTRLAEALQDSHGAEACAVLFGNVGLSPYLVEPPQEMVPEQHVALLHRALLEAYGPEEAGAIAWRAGCLTGDYLLANRIPRLAQRVLGMLPRGLAARRLVRAIARHAWTFAGSGSFTFFFEETLYLRLEGSPICRMLRSEEPACHYFAGTFERVFGAMLGRRLRVSEVECEAMGAPACLFRISW